MFCPECRCEFRRGFTHCGSCNVDLVENLGAAAESTVVERPISRAPKSQVRLVDFCGFLELDEARDARNALREEGIGAEITIRDLAADSGTAIEEEFWLRVDADAITRVAAIIGHDAVVEEAQALTCSECGATVVEDADACSECGASFEDN